MRYEINKILLILCIRNSSLTQKIIQITKRLYELKIREIDHLLILDIIVILYLQPELKNSTKEFFGLLAISCNWNKPGEAGTE